MKTLANRDDLNEIIGRIESIRPDSPRQWGRMSSAEMIRHCIDALSVGLGDKKVGLVKTPLPRSVLKLIVLYAPMKWPKNVPTGAPIDPQREGSKPGEFSADLGELVRVTHRFVLSKKQDAKLNHPFFGPLSDREWLRWGYLHQDHHLRQFGL